MPCDYIGSNTTSVRNLCGLLICLLNTSFDMNIYDFFKPKSQQRPSMRNVKHTQLLANHSRGRLLPSLQSSTPIQTEPSDWGGGQNRTENSLLLQNDDVFI